MGTPMAYVEDVIDMGLMGRGGNAMTLGRTTWYRAWHAFMTGPQRIRIASIPDLCK